MLKIAIITINDNNNYGNRLQNYALQQYLLKKIKIEKVDTIWYDPKYKYMSQIDIVSWRTWIKYIINWKNQRKYLKKEYLDNNIRMYNIGKFTKNIKTKLDFKIRNNLNKEYDYFITGSDQVWNPNFWSKRYNHANIRFLKFASKEKRIAYAASIAIPEIPKDKEQFFRDSLNEMKTISMREKAGAELARF